MLVWRLTLYLKIEPLAHSIFNLHHYTAAARSGTSIGANINEANYGQSPSDFISKMHIALKETAETEYWIKLLYMSEYIDDKTSSSLLDDCLEIKRILVASINTAKENNK